VPRAEGAIVSLKVPVIVRHKVPAKVSPIAYRSASATASSTE
jgi:hypothetical protein